MGNTCHKNSFEKLMARGLHQAWSRMWNTACRARPVTASNPMGLAGLLHVVVVAVSRKKPLCWWIVSPARFNYVRYRLSHLLGQCHKALAWKPVGLLLRCYGDNPGCAPGDVVKNSSGAKTLEGVPKNAPVSSRGSSREECGKCLYRLLAKIIFLPKTISRPWGGGSEVR
jgi:hypothetical protein